MSDKEEGHGAASAPAPGQWREDAARAREEPGGTVAESAAHAEGSAHARERVAAARQQIDERTARARDKAARALKRVHERTPERVRSRAREAAVTAGRNRDQILAVVSGVVLIYLAVRRTKR